MDHELLEYINMGMKWNIMKKGRTSMTRRPRKPGADGFESVFHIQESTAFKSKKSILKVVDASSKKKRILRQSTSPPPQTLCANGKGYLWPEPQTPSVPLEDSGHWSNSRSKSQKTKSKSRLRNKKMKCTKKPNDFSGIELLVDVACSLIQENADHVEDCSMLKEHPIPEVKSCFVDTKEATIVSPGSNGSSVQQNVHGIGKGVEGKKVFHWDLNTVMDEWDIVGDDLLIEPVKHEDASNSIPCVENCNVDSFEEPLESVEDLEVGTKTVTVKTSDGESSASKSEVVDPLTHPAKCEDFSNSTTSVLKEQIGVNCESETIDGPKLDQQPVSECCSNVTQEEQVLAAEGDPDDKIQAGYDSPFEDGELREPLGEAEKKALFNESDNIYKEDFDTTENLSSEKVDHGQTMEDQQTAPSNEIEQGVKADTSVRPHSDEPGKVDGRDDEPTSFDACMNGEYIHRSRSSNMGETSMRVWDLKSHRSLDRSYPRNYNSRGGGYRAQDRRPSPPERNNGYSSYRGPPPARSHSGERYRFHSQEYYDRKQPCYSEAKPQFSSSFNQPGTHCRSRSRSGSPIAWHFQKRKNSDTSNPGGEFTTEPERSSKCIDDHHRPRDGYFRDKREAPIITSQQKQRYDLTGYPERSKPDDYCRYSQRPARFSQMTGYKYKEYNEDIRKHDGYYEKGNRVSRDDDGSGSRRFRYAHNR